MRNPAEIDKLWRAATELWVLVVRTLLQTHGMLEMSVETMTFPLAEKCEQGDEGISFGRAYLALRRYKIDETGALDTVEFINVTSVDALAWPNKVHRGYPPTVNTQMDSTVKPVVQKLLAVNYTLLDVLRERLGLPKDALEQRHPLDEPTGSEARCIQSGPRPEGISEEKAAIGAHTDFGYLSLLHNRLGGLQPIPGHAICNLGDAMTIFSGGMLRSNLHHVVPPPKEQGKYERWSLVFFTRPGNSPLIAKAIARLFPGKYDTGQTSKEWFARGIKN
ncbi:hypothetical protein BD414DRAFT_484617 [Trametes punicea]|nr:hypothetical protein BD414DRAFT_484617 [Trametes punicea]